MIWGTSAHLGGILLVTNRIAIVAEKKWLTVQQRNYNQKATSGQNVLKNTEALIIVWGKLYKGVW